MLRVVLDSSVLVSGFLTAGGTTAALFDHYRQRAFALCCSSWIVGEVERALLRPKNMSRYRYMPGDVREFLAGPARSAEIFQEPPQVSSVTRDPATIG